MSLSNHMRMNRCFIQNKQRGGASVFLCISAAENKGDATLIYVIFQVCQDYPEQYLPVALLATCPVLRAIKGTLPFIV